MTGIGSVERAVILALFLLIIPLGYNACGSGFAMKQGEALLPSELGTSKTCLADPQPLPAAMRRLSREEYANALRDTLGLDGSFAITFPPELFKHFSNDRSSLQVGAELLTFFMDTAEAAVNKALTDAGSRAKIMTCTPTGNAKATCIQEIAQSVGLKVYRRPLTGDDLAVLAKIVTDAETRGESTEAGLKLALQAMFISPDFLYLPVLNPSPDDPASTVELSSYELASRLSFFLWATIPDAELFAKAKSGEIKTPDVLKAQTLRLLKDPRAKSLATTFMNQWFTIPELDKRTPDTSKFPSFTPQLQADMKQESILFFEDIWKNDLPVTTLLDAKYTFVNDRLATHYGLNGVAGAEFRKVDLTGTERVGILSHGSVLTITSKPSTTSIIRRGHYVLENFLCQGPPPPPPNAEAGLSNFGPSVREQANGRAVTQPCLGCHTLMDPIGFGLENFDAVGAFRLSDGGASIDSLGRFSDGTTFDRPAGLVTALEDMGAFNACATKHVYRYALGFEPAKTEGCAHNKVALESVGPNKKFSDLVLAVVRSRSFTTSRGGAP